MLSKRSVLDDSLIGIKDDDTLLIDTCELIAPMTRIRGKFKLSSTAISFIPDQNQPNKQNNGHEINLAQNPPPLSASKSRSPRCAKYRAMETKTLNTFSLNNSNRSLSSVSHKSSPSQSALEAMVLSNDTNNKWNEYWIAVNVCSSYQQVGGTRYRLMNAHRFWFIDQLNEIYYRRYQLRKCALELFFNDETSWLFTFYDEESRNKVFNCIISLDPPNLIETVEFFRHPKQAIKRSQIHYKWCRREISNFEYLMRLNIFAGRTFNDLTQYPVLPWVITDFVSDALDLNDDTIYRDLSKPIGALDDKSRDKFMSRYKSLREDNEKHCFMYGTHYSSIGNILYYLLRMQPFTTYNLKFQDGKFDTADRLFHSVSDTFNGCLKNTGDVKELIPEFYYLTDFLCNKQRLDLGKRHCDEAIVNDVLLPSWANNSAETFIKTMREALESEYVSSHLHDWIDLIFGYKQQGAEAEEACNVFHPYTYEGNVDIDAIEDELEKMAILSQIDEYGQTPMQLFHEAHPKRFKQNEVLSTIFKSKKMRCYSRNALSRNGILCISKIDRQIITIGSDYALNVHKWNTNKLCIEKHKKHLSFTKLLNNFGLKSNEKHNTIGGDISLKIIDGNSCFAITNNGAFAFCCGFDDDCFIIWDVMNAKIVQKVGKHQDIVSCLALDEDIEKQKAVLVTGSHDKSVIVWRVNIRTNALIDLEAVHLLVNQLSAIQCVDISLKSGIIACCSLDGMVNVYNASTGDHYYMLQPFVDKAMKERKEHQLKHHKARVYGADEKKDEDQLTLKSGIECSVLTAVRVSDVFGYILCYSKQTKDVFLYSSNGKMIACYSSNNDVYNDIQFSKSANYIVCGGKNAIVRIKQLPSFQTIKKFREATVDKMAITKIYIEPKTETSLFVGTANGNIYVYSLPLKAFVEVRIGALGRHGF